MGELVDRVDENDLVIGVVDRAEAIEKGWLHRVATTVCRDPLGRILVHRRPDGASRFPGQYNWLIGGAAEAGESWEQAAARELGEELGVFGVPVRPVFRFLCEGEISPYWLGVHEAVLSGVAALRRYLEPSPDGTADFRHQPPAPDTRPGHRPFSRPCSPPGGTAAGGGGGSGGSSGGGHGWS